MGNMQTQTLKLVIQYTSDIHLEMKHAFDVDIPVLGDVLILAGDIGSIRQDLTREFLSNMAKKFPHVVYVSGNHEYYQWAYTDKYPLHILDEETIKFCSSYPTLHYLNGTSWQHPQSQVSFVGGCLWSFVPESKYEIVGLGMNDYRQCYWQDSPVTSSSLVRQLTVKDTVGVHLKQRQAIENAIASDATNSCVVVTHHLPSFSMIEDDYREHPLNVAFATGMDEFILKYQHKIKAWVCGHTHRVREIKIGTCPIIMNCIGYPHEEKGKRYDKIMKIY